MERKIGEIFEYNGEWYQCVEQPGDYEPSDRKYETYEEAMEVGLQEAIKLIKK